MSDSTCGTCRYYSEWSGEQFGDCRWPDNYSLPASMDPLIDQPMYRTDGSLCPEWLAKEDPAP